MNDQQPEQRAEYPVTDAGLGLLYTELGRLMHLTYEQRLAHERLLTETRSLQAATRAFTAKHTGEECDAANPQSETPGEVERMRLRADYSMGN